mmetsp:Transcript_30258/g.47369  ORF Transcript_30258/g.47369 Transcript_30258/m.47369 type:complete len:105 (-) Transcript_30258:71-385(-)
MYVKWPESGQVSWRKISSGSFQARCNKRRGPEFQAWLSQGPSGFQVEGVTFKDYEDTKIKLHFSHFKILEDTRKTCFRDEPHQCEEFKKEEDEVLQESSVHSEL